jgi:hypothetical protein
MLANRQVQALGDAVVAHRFRRQAEDEGANPVEYGGHLSFLAGTSRVT